MVLSDGMGLTHSVAHFPQIINRLSLILCTCTLYVAGDQLVQINKAEFISAGAANWHMAGLGHGVTATFFVSNQPLK